MMAFVYQDLSVKRRFHLENEQVEAIWLELCPFNSKRSLILGSIYRPPSSKKDDDIAIESNVERISMFNKETIIVSDINIDYKSENVYNKHRISKRLRSLHFKQLVDFVTRPVSKTCPDHVYCHQPQHFKSVTSQNIGLADHLPVFVVSKYAPKKVFQQSHRSNTETQRVLMREVKVVAPTSPMGHGLCVRRH